MTMGHPDPNNSSRRRARSPFGHRFALAGLGALAMALLGAASAVAAPTWVSPTDLSVAGRDATAPQIAIDAAGEAVAVWRRSDGSNFIIQSASRPPDGTFSAPVGLSVAKLDAFEPQIAITAGGEAVAVWTRINGANFIIQSASRPPGGTFSTPVNLSVVGQNSTRPQIAINAGGEAVAVWESFNGANSIIQGAARPPGGAFSPLPDLSVAGKSASQPQIAIDPAGEAIAVWQRSDGTSSIIQSAARSAGGAFSAPADLSVGGPEPAKPRDASQPQVAIDAAGGAVAVWRRFNGANTITQEAVRPPGGAFSAAADLSAAGRDVSVPQIAINPGGEAVAVWQGSNGLDTIIQGAARPSGGSFSALPDLSAAGRDASQPQVAIDPAGEAIAVWQRSDGNNTIVQSAARLPGGAFAASPDLSVAGRDANAPQVAVDPAGEAAAIWERSNGTNKIIQAAVTAKNTKAALLCKPSPVTVGVAVTCTATVSDAVSGPDAPTGTLKFTSNAAGAFAGTCTLAAAGPGNSSCQIAYTPSQVGSGTHTITASYQGDSSHVKSDGTAQVKVQGKGQGRGHSAPDTTLKKKPRKKTVQRRAVFRFVSDQPGSRFQCKLDRKPFKACRSPFKAKVKPGRHTFSVRAVNPQGVADQTPAVFHWKVGKGKKRRSS